MTPPDTDLAAQVAALARCDANASAQTLVEALHDAGLPLAYAIHWAATGTEAALHALSYGLSSVDALTPSDVALAALLAREHNAAHLPEVAIHLAQTLIRIEAMGAPSASVIAPWVAPFLLRCLQRGGLSALAAVEHIAATAQIDGAADGRSHDQDDALGNALLAYAQTIHDAQDRDYVAHVAATTRRCPPRCNTAPTEAARRGLEDLVLVPGLAQLGADQRQALALRVAAAVGELDAAKASVWSGRVSGAS